MYSYKLRITFPTEEVDRFLINCRDMESRYFSKYVRCKEVGEDTEKLHYHYFVVCDCEVALRQFIRDRFGRGNGVYSLKKLDSDEPIEYLSYLIKEDDNSVWFNISPDLKKRVIEYGVQVKKNKEMFKKSGGKLNVIREFLMKKYGNIPIQVPVLVDDIVEFYLSQGWALNMFHIKSYVITILVSYSDNYKKRFKDKIIQDCIM